MSLPSLYSESVQGYIISSLNDGYNSPVRLYALDVFFWGRFLTMYSITLVYISFQITHLFSCQFREAVFFKEFSHFIELDKYISIMQFIVFPYFPFNVCRICIVSHLSCLI